MNVNIDARWKEVLQEEFDSAYFKELNTFITSEYAAHQCFPPKDQIFAAFNQTPFDEVKVVILGQDPYHGLGQANGLSFSVADGIKKPPSLKNIFKELNHSLNIEEPEFGNLERWASQGVLLLNATLTVRAHTAQSHQRKGWEQFTDAVITKLSENRSGIVFLLWGAYAKKKGAKIDKEKHEVLCSGHPSPMSANQGKWFGNDHFKKANVYLKEKGKQPINW